MTLRVWQVYRDQVLDPLVHLDETSDGIMSEPYDPKRGIRQLSKFVDLDRFLGSKGLSIDAASRLKLIREIAQAQALAAKTIQRFAERDYRPDKEVERFPPWQASRPVSGLQKSGSIQFEALVGGWAKNPKEATLALWRSYISEFVTFVGHDDPSAIRRQDVVAWKQKLLEDGISPKTINDSKLAALKAVLGWAADNELRRENPAARVAVKRVKKPGQRMLGFSKDEAAAILRAASQQNSPVYRWVPSYAPLRVPE